MKKTKIIVPALGLLLLSTAASVTGTVAWFAANTTVTATGMSVTVKSDSTFLLIKAGEATLSEVRTGKKISDTAVNQSAALYPVAHESIANIAAADEPSNWYYKTSDDPSLYGGANHESAATALTSLDNYVLVNEFTLAIAEGGNNMSNIKVGACTITTAGDAAVNVLVASASASQEFTASGDGSTVLQSSLTTTAVMSVKVYIYWNGADEDVTTNGIADLQTTSVELTFTGSVVAAA